MPRVFSMELREEFFDLVGMQEVRSLETRYGVPDEARVNY